MRGAAVRNEFAKMRHLRVGPLAGILMAGIVLVALGSGLSNPDFDTADAWNVLLGSVASAVALVAPLVIATLASRQIDMEHQGSGWLLSATSGVAAGVLCRAKFLSLGLIIAIATVTASAFVIGFGLLAGVTTPIPMARWLGLALAMVTVNLVVLAVHLLLSAHVENQLVSIGIGLLGTVFALFGASVPLWLTHLTPWGYYSLSSPTEYRGEDLVAITPAYESIAGLAVVGTVAFVLLTAHLNSREA